MNHNLNFKRVQDESKYFWWKNNFGVVCIDYFLKLFQFLFWLFLKVLFIEESLKHLCKSLCLVEFSFFLMFFVNFIHFIPKAALNFVQTRVFYEHLVFFRLVLGNKSLEKGDNQLFYNCEDNFRGDEFEIEVLLRNAQKHDEIYYILNSLELIYICFEVFLVQGLQAENKMFKKATGSFSSYLDFLFFEWIYVSE